ncbi:MAG: serine/threonine protein kinase, partial [Planctomycetes bacterium]|nr:serine/threonine protein kinase [Planctomycetota bacterium]
MPPGLTRRIAAQGTEARYAIDKPLAAGGMGAVLAIEDHDFHRAAAMKVIHAKFTANPEALERFLAEAQVTAQLEHPNIVPIHDLGVMEDGTLYFTMKLIEGQSVGALIKTLKAGDAAALKRWTIEEKILTFLKVLDGVGFANAKGVVHRDIKPDNIMLGLHGEVLVVDWGIAKVIGQADGGSVKSAQREVASVRDQDGLSMTMEGAAMGTIFYMPPEQAAGRLDEIDARSDVYALGATLYELLSLKRTLEGNSLPDLIGKITTGNIIGLDKSMPTLHPDLVAVVHRAMALDRANRYATCAEFADDLRRYLAGRAVLARTRNLI